MNNIDALLPPLPGIKAGEVWLVGAGPGDPGLLTQYAIQALRQADVVVYDALVAEDILALAVKQRAVPAVLEFMGKRGGMPSLRQEEISARLVALAKEGKKVLRLKGGDPFVFGRGPEEALELARNGISFRIVPGVTAGVAAPAYAGVPVTAGETNSAVAFLSGQGPGGGLPPDLDVAGLAKSCPVLVLYMGIKVLPDVVAILRQAGRSESEPVAVIQNGTTTQQRQLITTLGEAEARIDAAGIGSPAIIVIGPSVALASSLAASLLNTMS